MKVGIVTFHRAHNYGAVLQAYALQSYLKFLGCEVFFIDHKNESMLSCYKIWDVHRFISKHPTKMLNKIQNEVRLIKHRINRYNKFKNFINSFFCLKNASSSNGSSYSVTFGFNIPPQLHFGIVSSILGVSFDPGALIES